MSSKRQEKGEGLDPLLLMVLFVYLLVLGAALSVAICRAIG